MFNKVIIIGVGQIGASIGMNLVAKKLAREVVGVGRDPRNLREAIRNTDSSDLIILATPVRTIRDLLKKMPKGPLIIDVGSTKAAIVKTAQSRKLRFVGCHPIAGTEIPGAKGADKNLFRGKVCILTPSRSASTRDVTTIRRLWARCGSRVLTMTPERHDRVLATFSHLPHVLAYSLITQAPALSVPRGLFAGLGSFRGATRVAASSPEMWRDIFLENRRLVGVAIDRAVREIRVLKGLVTRAKGAALLRYLTRAQKRRLEIS